MSTSDTSLNPTYQCKRGWIITMDDTGGYVPFFVRVRGDDIVWVNNFGYEYNVSLQKPTAEFVVESENWIYTIRSDGRFRAKYIGSPNIANYKRIYTVISKDEKITAGANVKIELPISVLKADTIIMGNMEPVGTCYTYFKGGRHKSYSQSKVYDTIDIEIRCTYDTEIISDFNAQALDAMINSGVGNTISIYMEGTIAE